MADEPEERYVMWDGPKGTEKGAEGEVTGVAIFRKGIPTKLPEPTAKHIVELAEEKAGEVKDPLPAHFRYAKAAEVKALLAEGKAAAKETAAATAAAAEPAEEAPVGEEG